MANDSDYPSFPTWGEIAKIMESTGSAIALGRNCACLEAQKLCSDCRLSSAMAIIGDTAVTYEDMRSRLIKLREENACLKETSTHGKYEICNISGRSSDLSARTDCAEPESRSFLAWLHRAGVREATAPELTRLYARYTSETGAPVVQETFLRRCLLSLNGVKKVQREAYHDGRRWRPTVWEFRHGTTQ